MAMSSTRSLLLLAVATALLGTAPLTAQRPTGTRTRDTLSDSLRAILQDVNKEAYDAGRNDYESRRRAARVTSEDSAKAFADQEALAILARAREARLRQDSALKSYRAITTQRMDFGLGVRRLGLEKVLFRGDNVARVDWSRSGGVWVTPIGSRAQVPMAGGVADGDMVDAVSIPYFPGKESLWLPSSQFGVVKADVDERELVHPIANGAEAYYRYQAGDSMTITLGGGRAIRLRELRITARRPQWRLFVGSFWFDRESGQLVRAAYRLATQIEFWGLASETIAEESQRDSVVERVRDSLARTRLSREDYVKDSVRAVERRARMSDDDDEAPGWVKAAFQPFRGSLDAVTVEYGLYGNGRFWLPRANSATFSGQFGPMRTPFTFSEKFEYEDVDGDFITPPVPPAKTAVQIAAERAARRDSLRADSIARTATGSVEEREGAVQISVGIGPGDEGASLARRDSVWRRNNCRPGDSTFVRTETRYGGALRVAYTMPCDREALRTSAALPPPTATDNDLFDLASRAQLLESLGLSLQPAWGPQRPTVRTGLDLIRYNRVEGLSVGVLGEQVLGAGYTARGQVRLGHADQQLNAELGFDRTTGRRTVYGTVYRRLRATAPEWGDPLSFGPSLPALFYGRDEGFYFRATGVEVGDRRVDRGSSFSWRLFHEQQRTAGDTSVVNTWTLGRTFGQRFRTNFDASRVALTGLELNWSRAFGANPAGLQLLTSARGEGATGTVTYGRAALEATLTRPVARVQLGLTASAGTSVGELPPQRGWFLGGLRTVRGLPPGSAAGDAYWFARPEIGTRFGAARPVLFFDAGWAGTRDAFGQGRMLRGAGAGVSLIDGLIRFDVARNLARGGRWRADLYLGAPI